MTPFSRFNYFLAGFYEEEEKTLDAVYIGSSNCHTYWNSLFAWEQYGINVYPYTANSLPFSSAEYVIKEVRNRQPNAVFVVNINTLGDEEITMSQSHNLLDHMPLTFEKLALTKFLCEFGEYPRDDHWEYYFPIIQYHSRWGDITESDFYNVTDGYKGACNFDIYKKKSTNIFNGFKQTEEVGVLSEKMEKALKSLLEYCKSEDIEIVFVTVPQSRPDLEDVKKYNRVNEMVSEYGFRVLDLIGNIEDTEMDLKVDFYNSKHANIHGSIKYTQFLSEYLIENFKFEDKRGKAEYSDWDKAYNEYYKEFSPYVLDIELDSKYRDYSLEAPSEKDILTTANGTSVRLEWKSIEGATGYVIYKKSGKNGAWKKTGYSNQLIYEDKDVKEGKKYTYTIVPFYEKDGENYYGKHLYKGVNVTN